MYLIFGGAYQGKLDYAKEALGIGDGDIFYCDRDSEKPEIDFSKKAIYGLEQFTLACTRCGIEAKDYLAAHLRALENKVIICTDISQGVVPVDKEMRAWREMNGRAMLYLSGNAGHVVRVFCGLPQVLKSQKSRKGEKAGSYIHFIRHGTTEGNVKKWYYGDADLPLLEEGKALIASLKEQGIYPETPGADYYTSGLQRTEETFEIIFGDEEHEAFEAFREMSFGQYEQHTYEELKELPEYQEWISDETGTKAPPEGESAEAFRKRVARGLKVLMGLHKLKEFSLRHSGKEAHSVVVCHGGVISVVMEEMFRENGNNFYAWIPDPGHGYTVKIENGKPAWYIKF